MKVLPKSIPKPIPLSVRKDLLWWHKFLPLYNGVSMMAIEDWSQPDEVLETEACLLGFGAWNSNRQYFHMAFPQSILDLDLHINALEMLTIIVACQVWGKHWPGKRLVVNCDNEASVTVLNTGRSRDPFLQACLRELAFVTARFEVEIRGNHVPGVTNRIPDALSRWDLDPKFLLEFHRLVGPEPVHDTFVYEGFFQFAHDW